MLCFNPLDHGRELCAIYDHASIGVTWPVYVHYMAKSVWKPAYLTPHSESKGISMKLISSLL